MQPVDRIVGELLQPGGVRCLERLGLASCAKHAAVDGVEVEGYALVLPPGALSGGDAAESGASPASTVLLSYPARDPAGLGEQFGWTGAAGGGVAGGNVCSVTGADIAPRGRSFHNHHFVPQLRRTALAEPNVKVRAAGGMRWPAASLARSASTAYSTPPPPFPARSTSAAPASW